MSGPQDAETLQNEGSREAPANQIDIETACAFIGRIPLPGLPVAPSHPVEDLLLRYLAEGLGDACFRRGPGDAPLAQVLLEAVPAETLMLQPRARIASGEAAIVDVALLAKPLERACDFLGGEALAEQSPPQLAGRVVAARQLLERALIG